MLVVGASLMFAAQTAFGCTCVQDSLGERFRRAKVVFVARGMADEPEGRSLVQNYADDDKYSQALEVLKGYKGVKKKFVRVTFDKDGLKNSAWCPTLYYFEPNRQYLVFAYGKDYEVEQVCSDTREIPAGKEEPTYQYAHEEVKRLDSFWFRLRARLNPF